MARVCNIRDLVRRPEVANAECICLAVVLVCCRQCAAVVRHEDDTEYNCNPLRRIFQLRLRFLCDRRHNEAIARIVCIELSDHPRCTVLDTTCTLNVRRMDHIECNSFASYCWNQDRSSRRFDIARIFCISILHVERNPAGDPCSKYGNLCHNRHRELNDPRHYARRNLRILHNRGSANLFAKLLLLLLRWRSTDDNIGRTGRKPLDNPLDRFQLRRTSRTCLGLIRRCPLLSTGLNDFLRRARPPLITNPRSDAKNICFPFWFLSRIEFLHAFLAGQKTLSSTVSDINI